MAHKDDRSVILAVRVMPFLKARILEHLDRLKKSRSMFGWNITLADAARDLLHLGLVLADEQAKAKTKQAKAKKKGKKR